MKLCFVAALLLAVVCTAPGEARAAEGETAGSYRGFQYDDSAVRDRPNVGEMRTALQGQIDMVLVVGLPEDVVEAFRKVPLAIMPDGAFQSPTPGRYLPGKRMVQLVEGFARMPRKPILLHELMHAYQHQVLADGLANAQVLEFYERAKTLQAYAAKSHMMSNVGEFFACSTTAYLYGGTAQEPFTRARLKEKQPVYFGYLQKLLGAGSYEGKL